MDQDNRAERDQKLSKPAPGGFPADGNLPAPVVISENEAMPGVAQEAEVTSAAMAVRPFGGSFLSNAGTLNNSDQNQAQVAQPVVRRMPETTSAQIETNHEEEAIVNRVLAGDTEAFSELIERYKVAVFNLCARMLHNPTEAEDAAQEVFVRAYTQLHSYQPGRRFSTWILSIASHYCIDLLRRRKPQVDLEAISFWKQSDLPEPEERALTSETRDEVRDLLSKLPEKYRGVTVLRYWQDMSYEEIAEASSLSVATVKTRLFRARELLAKELEKQRQGGNKLEQPKVKSRGLLKKSRTVNGNAEQ